MLSQLSNIMNYLSNTDFNYVHFNANKGKKNLSFNFELIISFNKRFVLSLIADFRK